MVGRNHKILPGAQPRILAKTLGEALLFKADKPYERFDAEFLNPLRATNMPGINSASRRWNERGRDSPNESWGQLFIHAVETARYGGCDVYVDDKVTVAYAEPTECQACQAQSTACDSPWGYVLEGLEALGLVADLEHRLLKGVEGADLKGFLERELSEREAGGGLPD